MKHRFEATLLLDGELVLHCHECGCPSTADIRGAEGWRVVRARPGSRQLVDLCRECAPRHFSFKAAAAAPF